MNTKSLTDMPEHELRAFLEALANQLVDGASELGLHIKEGVVMTYGPAPYRRLDCDGRALAYIRVRPRKLAVRVDITGLWIVERDNALRRASAASSGTFFIRDVTDADSVVQTLGRTVIETRLAYAAEKAG